MAKKKRSAKQLANDKRLGRMAKARGKKKTKTARRKTVKRKTTRRKKNPERITAAWLDKRVGLLNDMLKLPSEPYSTGADGKLKPNAGNLHIDHAYGGVGVEQMARGGGTHAISGGHEPKRELNNFINGMIEGVMLAQNKSRKWNPQKARPGLPKAKRTALKKSNLWIAFVCWPKQVSYAYIADTVKPRVGIGTRKNAAIFQTKTRAHNVAKLLAKNWPGGIAGVAKANATTAEIKAACRGKA